MTTRRNVLGALVLAMFATAASAQAPAASPEPACGTKDKPAWCASIDTGAVTVVTRGERHEYLTGGGTIEGPLGAGLAAFVHVDAFGTQDGGSLNGTPRTFRTLILEAGVSRSAGALRLSALGGVTYSIEGQLGAPIEPRLWQARFQAEIPLDGGGYIGVSGGLDDTVGGFAVRADVDVPVAGGPAVVAHYNLPIRSDVFGRKDWVLTAGGRVHIKSFRLHVGK
jgi:hypothetical protein